MDTRLITYKEAIDFLLPLHYSGRKPCINWAFGWFESDQLKAACTIGKPASNSLCVGIAGSEHSASVYELNRLCRVDDLKDPLSKFLSECLKYLKKENLIIVSYADSSMKHCGYIYQACNFLYTGATKSRTDKYTEGNKHSRHYSNDSQGEFRKVRSAKNRYVYFCANSKRQRKEWLKALNYKVEPYPKTENETYTLGDYQQPNLVKRA